ncbi:hypothetical protein NDU88_001503 [Pleurodeles waltl]|uniref:Uncharacterized protein n=1 Tax=Pleurodeles waltl TaxID=8319 RepID=A0AAV7V8H8_PLEWA|nr:hypothetical protein NDU88_001503 [Pleurodeles waltl]
MFRRYGGCPNYHGGGPGEGKPWGEGSCAGKGLAESSLDSTRPQDFREGQVDETKNLKQQMTQSESPTALNSIEEQEERVKDTHNLVKECPESCCREEIEREKERTTAWEDVVKDWTFETRKVEKDWKHIDWSNDGGDKFYSLTEDSEAVSSGYDLSEEDGSVSSEAESFSSSVGPTVRQQLQHCMRIKSRTGSVGVVDSPEGCAATLKWDYSGIRLSRPEKDPKGPKDTVLTVNLTEGENCPSEQINNMANTDTKMLHLIYRTVREMQTETRAESRRARMATKQLQVTVHKIAKSCAEIEEKLNTVESRTSVVEGEAVALNEHVETQGGQLTDVMWKLKDFENQQIRNNLRFLEIEEGEEGNDVRAFMIKLLYEHLSVIKLERCYHEPIAAEAACDTCFSQQGWGLAHLFTSFYDCSAI